MPTPDPSLSLQTELIPKMLRALATTRNPALAWQAALIDEKANGVDPRKLLQDLMVIKFLGSTAPTSYEPPAEPTREEIAADVARELIKLGVDDLCQSCQQMLGARIAEADAAVRR